ncbi:MAG: STAS domain-containing protein [Deltaproteobacteria bacterium]|nr:STAS domain-containing protein [Deltaproteobacteria bacterium]
MNRSLIAVIELAGDINCHVLEELSALIGALVDEHRRHVVVNLAGMARLDGRDVDSLVERAKQLRSIGGDLKIVGLNRTPGAPTGRPYAAGFFEPYDSLQAAVDGFEQEHASHLSPGL